MAKYHVSPQSEAWADPECWTVAAKWARGEKNTSMTSSALLWFPIPPGSSRGCNHRIPTLIPPVCNFSSSVTVWCSRPRWFYFKTCDIFLRSLPLLSTSPLLGSAELWGRLRDASGVKVISLWKLSRGRAVRCAHAIEAIVRRDETVSVGVTHLGLLQQTSKHVFLLFPTSIVPASGKDSFVSPNIS